MIRRSIAAAFFVAVAAVHAEPTTRRSAPPENLIQVSWCDQIIVAHGDTALDTPAKIERAVDAWRQVNNASTILWRGSSYELDRYFHWNKSNIPEYESRVATIVARGDPIAVALRRAHADHMRLFMYLTFQDHGAPATAKYGDGPFPWQDTLCIEHPEWQTVDLRGNSQFGVLDYGYPEARRAVIDRIKSMCDDFHVDGLYLCSRTHSPGAQHADQFGFGQPEVAAMRDRFGVDITKDARFDYRSPQFAPDDPMVENWRRVRGESWTQFYRELRAALGDKPIYAGLPRGRYFGPPYGNVYLDWETLLRERLVDGLVLHVNTGRDISGKDKRPHAAMGYRSSEDDELNVPTMEQCVDLYGPPAHAAGAKLFYNSTFFAPSTLARVDALPGLDGLMLWSPTSEPNRGRIAHDDAFNAPGGAMTIAMDLWLSDPRPGGGLQRVLSKNDGDVDATKGWEVRVAADGALQFVAAQRDPNTDKVVEVTLSTPTPVPMKTWSRVAFTFDRAGRRLAIAVDDKTVAERAIPDLPLNVNRGQDVCVGFNGGWTWHYFDGQIDDLTFSASADVPTTRPGASTTSPAVALFARYRFKEMTAGLIANDVDPSRLPIILQVPTTQPLVARDGHGSALDLRLLPQE